MNQEEDEIEKALGKVNGLLKLGESIKNSTPVLNELKDKLIWSQKVTSVLVDRKSEIISGLEGTLHSLVNIDFNTFTEVSLANPSGSVYSGYTETKEIIKSYGSKYYDLITEYESLTHTDEHIIAILAKLERYDDSHLNIDTPLYEYMIQAKQTYEEWQAGLKNNSDLAKDIRAFQDVFNGFLHKLRWLSLVNRPKKPSSLDESWPKMAELLCKQGAGLLKSFRSLAGADSRLHLHFTEVMKGTKVVPNEVLEKNFKEYIELAYSVVNLLDESKVTMKK